MTFINDDNYFGNFDLLDEPIVAFLAANDTPEELWPRVQQWLEREIYNTDKVVISHFDTHFEKRVLQLLLEHNRPIILFTYRSTIKASFRKLNVSRTNPNRLVLRYRPSHNGWQSEQRDMERMAIINLSDEFITIGTTSDNDILKILDLYRQSPETPHRIL